MEAIVKHRKIRDSEIKKNSTIILTKFEETKNIRMSEFARLRLDLWY
jgi:hypothetical protein